MKRILAISVFAVLCAALLLAQSYTVYYTSSTTAPWGSYSNYVTDYNNLCAANPTWVCADAGDSVQGRKIKTIVVHPTGYNYTILIDSLIHSNEVYSPLLTRGVLQYLAAHPSEMSWVRFVVIMMSNPDGYVAGGQSNNNTVANPTRRVNLNHNFIEGWGQDGVANPTNPVCTNPASTTCYIGPYGDSEPESVVLRSVTMAYLPRYHFNVHGYEQDVYVPPGPNYTEVLTNIQTNLTANNYTQTYPKNPLTGYGGRFIDVCVDKVPWCRGYVWEMANPSSSAVTQEAINAFIGAVLYTVNQPAPTYCGLFQMAGPLRTCQQ